MRAIGIELVQADREELHHFARVVLIGLPAAGVFLEIAPGIEEEAHPGIERERLEQLAEIAEGMGGEHIPIGGDQVRVDRSVLKGVNDTTNISDNASAMRLRIWSGPASSWFQIMKSPDSCAR